jgi:hypothetical protein
VCGAFPSRLAADPSRQFGNLARHQRQKVIQRYDPYETSRCIYNRGTSNRSRAHLVDGRRHVAVCTQHQGAIGHHIRNDEAVKIRLAVELAPEYVPIRNDSHRDFWASAIGDDDRGTDVSRLHPANRVRERLFLADSEYFPSTDIPDIHLISSGLVANSTAGAFVALPQESREDCGFLRIASGSAPAESP